jgi:hypothetical protein
MSTTIRITSGEVECDIELGDDLSVSSAAVRGVRPPDSRVRHAIMETVAVASRSKLVGTARLNVSVFPLAAPATVAAYSTTLGRQFESVETALSEGIGVIASGSEAYQAATVWWVQAGDDSPVDGEIQCLIGARQTPYRASTATMRGFAEPTGQEFISAVIKVLAIPYSVLDAEAGVDDRLEVVIEPSGQYPIGGRFSVDMLRRRVDSQDLSATFGPDDIAARGMVRTAWWLSRVLLSGFPEHSKNNEPIRLMHVPSIGLPTVPRIGSVKESLVEGPGYLVQSSPTLESLCVWWLSDAGAPAAATADVVGKGAVPVFATHQQSYASLTGARTTSLTVNLLQIPLSAITNHSPAVVANRAVEPAGARSQ